GYADLKEMRAKTQEELEASEGPYPGETGCNPWRGNNRFQADSCRGPYSRHEILVPGAGRLPYAYSDGKHQDKQGLLPRTSEKIRFRIPVQAKMYCSPPVSRARGACFILFRVLS